MYALEILCGTQDGNGSEILGQAYPVLFTPFKISGGIY